MDEDTIGEAERLPDLTGEKLSDIVVSPRLAEACRRVHEETPDEVYTAFGNAP